MGKVEPGFLETFLQASRLAPRSCRVIGNPRLRLVRTVYSPHRFSDKVMHHYLGWIPTLDLAFLCQYSNYAWGRSHQGWYITRGGEVYSFKLNGGSYDLRQEALVPRDELAEYQRLLGTLGSDPWEERHHMCDAGVFRVTGFLHQDDGVFAEYPLYSRGDVHGERTSEDAQRILQWLKQGTPSDFDLWDFLDFDE